MKTLLASLLVASLATPAVAGPDFIARSPRPAALAASTGASEIGPLDDVVFEHDSKVLMSTATDQIASAARWLARHPRHRIVLEGYADSTGVAVYNEDLATARASIVRRQLMKHGIPSDRIVLVVYGERAARGGPHPLDRRVVMYGADLPVHRIVSASLDRKEAIAAMWTHRDALFTETRRGRPQVSTR